MLIQTDSSLYTSALTVKKGVALSKDTCVLCDTNLYSVPTFIYECRANNIKPVIGLQKDFNGAKYLFIARNKIGYLELVKGESTGFTEEIFRSRAVDSIILEVTDLSKNIFPAKYRLIGSPFQEKFLSEYSEVAIDSLIVNAEEESDIYTIGMIKANGEKSQFSKAILDCNASLARDSKFENFEFITQDIEDFTKFGDPTPPTFKFREEVSQELNIKTSSDQELFEHLCLKGLSERFSELNIPEKDHKEYNDRLRFEMDVIGNMRFPGYMLIVWDYINFTKQQGIPVGPGRGSAAGSLVAFVLRITNIDPIPYGLLFERFLNPDRVSFPDIDTDFSKERRQEVVDYLAEKYGSECVAQIITFGMIKGKSSIKDSTRVLSEPEWLGVKLSAAIPETPGMTIAKAYNESKDTWDKWLNEDYKALKIWKGAERLSDLKKSVGVHAAGVIVGTEPIYTRAPVYNIRGVNVVGFDSKYLEDVDLVKFDILGLKTLDVIQNAIDLIKRDKGITVDFNKIDINDPKVYDFIKKGKNLGIFQIESPGMRNLAKSLKPDCFEEVIAMLALYRPGPMESGMLESFVQRKNGAEEVSYFFQEMEPALKPILQPTYGVIAYQEQVMQIVQTIAGFTLGEADLVRRAMGKKDEKEMKEISLKFADGAVKNGFCRENAVKLFELIAKFAGYGFNKSHSAAYAMISFQTAYLKSTYPAEFFAALLNSEFGESDKIAMYVADAKQFGVSVVSPDILTSDTYFATKDGNISFALKAVKGVGSGATILQGAIEKLKTKDLATLILSIQTNKEASLATCRKKITTLKNKVTKALGTIAENSSKAKDLIARSRTSALGKREQNSLTSAQNKITKAQSLIVDLELQIDALEKECSDIENYSYDSEKLNQRVFKALASVGALDCFGYTRKFLFENSKDILDPRKTIETLQNASSEEYSKGELVVIEKETAGMILTNPFTRDYSNIEIPENTHIVVLIGRIDKKTKKGKPYSVLELLTTTGQILNLPDFNNKASRFSIGAEFTVKTVEKGAYTNLVSINKVDLKDFTIKKPEPTVLSINIFDPIPDNLSSFDYVNIYDTDGSLVAKMS